MFWQPDMKFAMTRIIIYMQSFMIRNCLSKVIHSIPPLFLSSIKLLGTYFIFWCTGNDLEESKAVCWLPSLCLWNLGSLGQWKCLEFGKEVELERNWVQGLLPSHQHGQLCFILNVFPYVSSSAKDILLSLKRWGGEWKREREGNIFKGT